MKHRTFKVTFFQGFKRIGASQVVSTVKGGQTIEEMTQYCKDKFPGKTFKVEV